ncbi:MAG TPA: sensor domain-containing diguanylate cyclase [Candidatus Eremiobacteraceae bacterium]
MDHLSKSTHPGTSAASGAAVPIGFPRAIAYISLLIALATLSGWASHVSWMTKPGATPAKVNTAICLALMSIAIVMLSHAPLTRNGRRIIYALMAVPFLIAVATLVEYIFGLQLGLDQALVSDPGGGDYPGRMGPNAAVALMMLQIGIVNVARGGQSKATIGHLFATAAAIIALVGIIGYFFDAAEFYRIEFTTAMSPVTAAVIFSLYGALLWSSQDRGFMRVINSENAAGFLVRRLLPPVIIVPVMLGWLCLLILSHGVVDDVEAGVCLLVTANVITLGALVAVNSRVLYRADAARELLQAQLRANMADIERQIAERTEQLSDTARRLVISEDRLALAVEGSQNGILDVDIVTGDVICSPQWRAMLGIAKDEPLDSRRALWDLGHPDDRERVMALAEAHYNGLTPNLSTEVRMRHSDGSYRWMLTRGRAVRDESGKAIRIVITQSDITEIKSLQERLENESTHDSMTGLYNRRHFEERLASTVHAAFRHKRPLSVCICDVDDFKSINDNYGHATGDRVLQSLAGILQSETRAGDVVARYGGDEFCILFPEVNAAQASVCAERIRTRLESTPFHAESGEQFWVTASFGLANVSTKDASQFIGAADRELYVAKEHGRNRLAVAP